MIIALKIRAYDQLIIHDYSHSQSIQITIIKVPSDMSCHLQIFIESSTQDPPTNCFHIYGHDACRDYGCLVRTAR